MSLAAVKGGTFLQRDGRGILHKFPISLAGQPFDKKPGPPPWNSSLAEGPLSGCLDEPKGALALLPPPLPASSKGANMRLGAWEEPRAKLLFTCLRLGRVGGLYREPGCACCSHQVQQMRPGPNISGCLRDTGRRARRLSPPPSAGWVRARAGRQVLHRGRRGSESDENGDGQGSV